MFKLTKHQRLKKPAEFQRVYQSKQWGSSQHFSFNVLALETKPSIEGSAIMPLQSVLGVTVSKKVSKRAVDRNRIKRQVREFFRHHQTDFMNVHIVITAKPSCLSASDSQRLESLQELWQKLSKWQRWHERQDPNA